MQRDPRIRTRVEDLLWARHWTSIEAKFSRRPRQQDPRCVPVIQPQQPMVTSGRSVSREAEGEGEDGSKETGKIEGQKMALWVRKNHKGCFQNNPIPVPTCWI